MFRAVVAASPGTTIAAGTKPTAKKPPTMTIRYRPPATLAQRRGDSAILSLNLREAIWAVFSALASGDAPREADLALISDAAAAGAARSQLVYDRDGVGWSMPSDGEDLERPFWDIARPAAELLTSTERGRVKQCASA